MGEVIWDSEAAQALSNVPLLVRALARRKVEERVLAQGRQRVLLSDFTEAQARFQSVMGGRSEAQAQELLPQKNRPGASLTVLEACHGQLSDCPHRLIDVEAWRQTVEKWLERNQVGERLRARVNDEQVLFHHKLRLAISGCANGCARPQIANLALVGTLRPEFYLDHCQGCGGCARLCPDKAIKMIDDRPVWDERACQGCLACQQACPTECILASGSAARVLMGGKLGRHPHLAATVGTAARPELAVEQFKTALDDFLDQAGPEERFAAWWTRTH